VRVLAVESATETAAVALADEEGVLGSMVLARGRRHTETIAPSIDWLCRRLGVRLGDVDALAVDVGPGLFTGLRVGGGTVQALVVTASSLEILAHGVFGAGMAAGTVVVPVVDARRAQVFSTRYWEIDGTLTEIGNEAVWSPEELAADLAPVGEPLVLAGNGALRYRSLLEEVPGSLLAGPAFSSPPVMALAELGVVRALAGDVVDGAAVTPRYLRQADARINWEQRIPARVGRAGGR